MITPCCICRTKGKDVQIHHIDYNKNNNDISNLAVLCLDDHSKVTGHRGLGKQFTSLEVSMYKKDWEFRVRRSKGTIYTPLKTNERFERILYEFEIGKKIYELSSIKDQESKK